MQSTKQTRFVGGIAIALIVLAARSGYAAWEEGDWAPIFETNTHVVGTAVSSDGAGGMLVAIQDQDPSPDRILVSRVDHTGTEVWGDGGITVPIDIAAQWQGWPVATAPGGAGSAYVAYREGYASSDQIRLARLSADGSFEWSRAIANLPTSTAWPLDVKLVPSAAEDVIIAWTEYGATSQKLRAARIRADSSVDWDRDLTQIYRHGEIIGAGETTNWDAAPDGAGGILACWLRSNGIPEVGAQRIDASGIIHWGNDGHLLWSGFGWESHDPRILADGAGGAWIVVSQVGVARGQRLASSGAELWAAGGVTLHDSQTSLFSLSTHPSIAANGLGGFYVAHGNEDMFVHQFDDNGSPIWPGAVALAPAGYQEHPSAVADGSGGVIVVYEDLYFATCPGQCWHSISGIRLDTFGNTLWSAAAPGGWLYLLWNDRDPQRPIAVADGSGGALVAWEDFPIGSSQADVRALGVNAAGEPAHATLSLLTPDSGSPGDVLAVEVLGDYLEPDLDYQLESAGMPSLPLAGVSGNFQLLGGSLDLSGAEPGDYSLVVRNDGIVIDSLDHAFGIGDMLPCDSHEPLADPAGVPRNEGSQRRIAIDADGTAHLLWLEEVGGTYVLHYVRRTAGGAMTDEPFYQTFEPLRSPSIDVAENGTVHVAFVREYSAIDQPVIYARRPAGGSFDSFDTFGSGSENRNPVLRVTRDDVVHVVYERGSLGAGQIYHVTHDGILFDLPQPTLSGPNATHPDVCELLPEGLMLTYVRDSVFPGLREVCKQQFTPSTWDQPEIIGFGLTASSASVACASDGSVLFAFGADFFTGSESLFTRRWTGGQLDDTAYRWSLPTLHGVSVAASGGAFVMLTEEEAAGTRELLWRQGDGYVFYPKRLLNPAETGAHGVFGGAAAGAERVVAYWTAPTNPTPLRLYDCQLPVTSVADAAPTGALTTTLRCSPNPFNPATDVHFQLATDDVVQLRIYDVGGHLVRELVDGRRPAGSHTIRWNGRTSAGKPAPAGVYLVRLQTQSGFGLLTKVTLVK